MPLTRTANGNIRPSRIVKLDTTVEGRCVESGAGDRSFGIAAPWTRSVPYSTLDDGYNAVAGENVTLYVDGDKDVPLQLGGTVTVGDLIKPDANALGVTAGTDKDQAVAIAKANGNAGDIIPVDVAYANLSI